MFQLLTFSNAALFHCFVCLTKMFDMGRYKFNINHSIDILEEPVWQPGFKETQNITCDAFDALTLSLRPETGRPVGECGRHTAESSMHPPKLPVQEWQPGSVPCIHGHPQIPPRPFCLGYFLHNSSAPFPFTLLTLFLPIPHTGKQAHQYPECNYNITGQFLCSKGCLATGFYCLHTQILPSALQ